MPALLLLGRHNKVAEFGRKNSIMVARVGGPVGLLKP
jgi:hypothetical protein